MGCYAKGEAGHCDVGLNQSGGSGCHAVEGLVDPFCVQNEGKRECAVLGVCGRRVGGCSAVCIGVSVAAMGSVRVPWSGLMCGTQGKHLAVFWNVRRTGGCSRRRTRGHSACSCSIRCHEDLTS